MDIWDRNFPTLTEESRRMLRRIGAEMNVMVDQEEGVMDDTPFEVVEEYQLPSLTEVKEDRVVVPAADSVLMTVTNANMRTSKDGSIKSVALQLRLNEGIPVPSENGIETRYQGKIMFADLPFWADTAIRTGTRYTGKNQSYLNPLKLLLLALGYDIANPPKISDTFLNDIKGRELRANIGLREIRTQDPPGSGKYVGTGEYVNELRNFKPA